MINPNSRREARIRKFGYYDYVELAHDYRRRVCIRCNWLAFLQKCSNVQNTHTEGNLSRWNSHLA